MQQNGLNTGHVNPVKFYPGAFGGRNSQQSQKKSPYEILGLRVEKYSIITHLSLLGQEHKITQVINNEYLYRLMRNISLQTVHPPPSVFISQ